MIYGELFDGMPTEVRRRVYRRLYDVLTGLEDREKYGSLSDEDRQAVLEILMSTKSNLPAYLDRSSELAIDRVGASEPPGRTAISPADPQFIAHCLLPRLVYDLQGQPATRDAAMQALFSAVVLSPVALFIFVCGSPIIPSDTGFVSHAPIAVVTVSGFFVITRFDTSKKPFFNQRFKLTETGGRSGATIQGIQSSVNGTVIHTTGADCWKTPIRVAPGATLDVFDAGSDSLGGCAPAFSGRTDATRFTIVVTFTDDDGQRGSVEATTTATGSGFAYR
jgi:hypothetical protein